MTASAIAATSITPPPAMSARRSMLHVLACPPVVSTRAALGLRYATDRPPAVRRDRRRRAAGGVRQPCSGAQPADDAHDLGSGRRGPLPRELPAVPAAPERAAQA